MICYYFYYLPYLLTQSEKISQFACSEFDVFHCRPTETHHTTQISLSIWVALSTVRGLQQVARSNDSIRASRFCRGVIASLARCPWDRLLWFAPIILHAPAVWRIGGRKTLPETGTAMRSCRTRKRAIISVTPMYCENLDMLTHSLGLIYTHPSRAGSRVRPVALAAVAADCGVQVWWLKVNYY